jgi:serine/threonine protein kinase
MTEPVIVFINDDAKDVSDLFLNKDWKIKKLYDQVYTITIGDYKLDWLVKTYSRQSHAKKEFSNLEKMKNVNGVPKLLASGFSKKLNYNMISRAPGCDLYDYVYKNGIMNEKEIRVVAKQLLAIIKNVHACDIIHGDIKPENIIYDRKNKVVTLIDFEDKHTEDYRSPEQVIEKALNYKTDVWSIGITLFFLKTKRVPFEGEREILNKPIKFPSTWSVEFSDFMSCLIERNLRFRYNTSEALNHSWITSDY